MRSSPKTKSKKPGSALKTSDQVFPIVAIGASAGGLEAISILFKNLPATTGMAFIYVQHLSPDHKSFLTSILSKLTPMKVQEIENMEHILPNTIYVIPPNKGIEVIDGHIQVFPRRTGLSIDALFSSLAETHKENVVGIILSGYANDGMKGLKAIKDAGGITFAQDDSAQASSMPKSAIDSGVVDYILSPKEIALELVRFSKSGFKRIPIKNSEKPSEADYGVTELESIFDLLNKEVGVDFSHYKIATIKRRLQHKMQQLGIKQVKDYVTLLLKNKHEVDALYQDFLINVTDFFRDKEAFLHLKNTLIPKLLNSKQKDESIRIWVPACSSGEEAYSLAMLFTELQDKKTKHIPVQIFATDLSDDIIRKARNGIFTENEIKSVPKKYLERFFKKAGTDYQVVKELRDMCVFAAHNILRDPPFSRMDFISCRNLLIYFDIAAQRKAFATLHFALNEGGYLMLGKAETTGSAPQLFTRLNNTQKVYSRKKETGVRKIPELSPYFPRNSLQTKKFILPFKNTVSNQSGIESSIDHLLLSDYIPACAIINKDMEILQLRGNISHFLKLSSGKASLNILKMIKPEFAFELRNAINKALKTKQLIFKTGLEIKIESTYRRMSFEVRPLNIEWDEPLLLIVFNLLEHIEKNPIYTNSKTKSNLEKDTRIKNLEEELESTRVEINNIMETHETTYEELQAANEESVSSNEEFQTLNEELETSKEEIEATNEELITTNQELQTRNDLLVELHEYSDAITATIHEPMVILESNFKVKSANHAFYKKFKVNREDTEGVLLFKLGNNQWNIPRLRDALTEVLSKNHNFENLEINHTFPEIGERIMLLNGRLIVQKATSDQLILLAIEDITEQSRFYLKEKYSLSLIEASLDPLVTINTEGKITGMNEATVIITGIERSKLIKSNFFDYFTEQEKAKEVYKQIFEKGSVVDFPLTLKHKNGRLTDVLFNGSVYKGDDGNVLGVVIVARDVTEQKRTQEILEKSLKEISDYKYALDESSIVEITDEKGIITHVNKNSCEISKYSAAELIGQDHKILNSSYHSKEFIKHLWDTIAEGKIWRNEIQNRAKDGSLYWLDTTIVPFLNEKGKPYQYVAIRSDITEQKKSEKALTEAIVFAELATGLAEEAKGKAESAAEQAEEAVKAKQQFLSNMSHEIRTPMNAIIGFTKVIMKTDLSGKQKEYLSAIKTSGDSLIVLINDILDLAKVDAGKMNFEKTPFKMRDSISAMLHLFETKIQEKNLELVKEYDNKIPEVLLGDPVRLHQIIMNLVSNAVKFTARGKISVIAMLLNETEEVAKIEFIVKDTGIGIPENKTGLIFDNFAQASSDTARLYGGTGLGLAIVKQLIESQGGTINVESEVMKGSSFSFILPFQKTSTVPDLSQDEIEFDTELKNIKVLVVEDIHLNQLLMKTLLDEFGFERDIAANGKIALEKLKSKTYDIVLMDLQMPVMNGFEATTHIRETMNSKIPIIALTADVTSSDVDKCMAIGMNDFIAKPVNEKLLYTKIVSLVKKSTVNFNKNTQAEIIKEAVKHVDLMHLTKRTKDNPKLMMEMISIYLEQTPPLILSMKQSLKDLDWHSLHAAVHKMIPSFSIMGINRDFESVARKIQEFANAQELNDGIHDMVQQLEDVCIQACQELKEEYERLNSIHNV